MGDTCCYSFSMGRISEIITNVTGAYVHSIMIGDSIVADEFNGFFKNLNEQVPLFLSAALFRLLLTFIRLTKFASR